MAVLRKGRSVVDRCGMAAGAAGGLAARSGAVDAVRGLGRGGAALRMRRTAWPAADNTGLRVRVELER
jgi:hypothetical protein